MWWLIPIGIGIGKIVYDYFTSKEIEARNRWEQKREQVQKTVDDHRRNIDERLQEAKNSYNFKLLTDVHYSSVIVADTAYKLLTDARISLDAISKLIVKTKKDKKEIISQLNKNDKNERNELFENIKLYNDIINNLLEDKDKIKFQRDDLLNKVRSLNQQTFELKIYIRDRCGEKGRNWYNRIEERNCQKRIRKLNRQAIAIKAFNSQYISANLHINNIIITANRPVLDAWEKFNIFWLGDDNIALQACNNLFIQSNLETNACLYANIPHIKGWETFKLHKLDNNKFAFQAFNGKFVSVKSNMDYILIADSSTIGECEIYEIQWL